LHGAFASPRSTAVDAGLLERPMRNLALLPCLAGALLAQSPVPRDPSLPTPSPTAPGTTAPRPELPKTAPAPRDVTAAGAHLQARPPRPSAPATGGAPALPDHVVFDRPEGTDSLWALGDSWKARFDGTGFQFVPFFGATAPRNFPLRIELQRAVVGEVTLPLRAGQPEVNGGQVRTARGSLIEVVDTSMAFVEQSFVFEALPNRGAIAVEIRLAGDFDATTTADGLRFGNEHGAVDYRKAIARDATGLSLPLTIDWREGTARIEIPATFVAQARLPLVLDPIVASNPGLAPGYASPRLQRNPDVAKVGATTCVVWTRAWSATDEDVVAQLLDDNLAPTTGAVYLDFTSQNWLQPRLAPNNYTQKFLCVAQADLAGTSWIAGRLIDTAAVIGAPLDIDRAGVAGHLPGNKFRPDVGGDGYLQNAAAFYTVVFEHEAAPGNHDIYYKQVNQDGSLRQVAPIALDTGSNHQSNPCIGVGNGLPTLSNRVLVAWQSQSVFPPFDENIWGAYVEWNGNLLIPAFQITTSTLNERRPAVSGVATATGTPIQMLAYEADYGTDNDTMLRVFDWNGTLLATHNLSGTTNGGSVLLRNQILPSVDSDGVRFVVGYAEYSGTDYDAYVSTLAYLPASGTCRLDEDRIGAGTTPGTDDVGPSVFAEFQRNAQPNPHYLLATANVGVNDIEVRRYGGHAPGAHYSVYPTMCGNLPISGAGAPALGNDITFTLTTSSFFSGFVFGFPALTPLGVCACTLGVTSVTNVPGPVYTWRVPNDPTFVGAFTLSIQGFAFGGAACLGAIDLSDTLDFQIH
jgi:hypothetical protein